MSYADYTGVARGYQPFAAPAPSVARAPSVASYAEPAPALVTADGKEGTFDELPVTDGVGDYHVNHFIGYGAYQPLKSPEKLVAALNRMFYTRFVDLFSPNEATAAWGKYFFHGDDTIEFEIGGEKGSFIEILGGLLHSDWVSMRMSADGESFYASTLRRKWLLLAEKLAVGLNEDVRGPIEINQHHFLAGRRSFKIGYSAELRRLYIETAAFERSSLCEYSMLEKTGVLRAVIVDLWTRLIENVENSFGKWVSPDLLPKGDQGVRQGYLTKRNVDYRADRYEKAGQALNAPWFAQVLARHPGLVKGLYE
jgi:hypothetical protein